MLFPKAPASCGKKSLKYFFVAMNFYLYELKKCLSFKILFQTGDINIFVYLCCLFLADMFN